jgi:hypothetical protein
MSLPKSWKEWIIFVVVSLALGVIANAIWAGLAHLALGQTPASAAPPPHMNLLRVAEFVYFVLVAIAGMFLGRYINKRFDLQWKPLYEKVNADYLQADQERTEYREKHTQTANERDQSKAEVERVLASIRKPSFPEHPIPDLRLRIVEMCTELQAFIGRYGPDVITVRQPHETVERFTARLSSLNLKEARIKLTGDYRLNYEKHVVQLRDLIGHHCAKTDEALNKAITLSGQGAGAAENLTIIIERFWELALNTNC